MNKMKLSSTIENMKNGIRKANIDDIPEMVKINIECWKNNYKGIIAQDSLDKLSIEDKLESWKSHFLEVKDTSSYYVKILDWKIVWFISWGKNIDEKYPYENEIYGLYVDVNYQGKNIGKDLMETILQDDKFLNCKSFCLWTLRDNPQSNHFYKKMWWKLFSAPLEKLHPRIWVPLAWYVREK